MGLEYLRQNCLNLISLKINFLIYQNVENSSGIRMHCIIQIIKELEIALVLYHMDNQLSKKHNKFIFLIEILIEVYLLLQAEELTIKGSILMLDLVILLRY
jgi:hypothetical protein